MGEDADVSFDDWVATRVPGLLRFAYLVTGSRDAADEALQIALAAAWERWPRVRSTTDPDAYVRRMIANAHISQWRKLRRLKVMSDVPDAEVVDHADRVSTDHAVWRVCSRLPRQQRAAVVLRFYEDLEYAEIAQVLDVTQATVRSHIHRAMTSMRRELATEEQP